MKCALHFATKLNSRDIQKCNCFWVPSYDLFASARKAIFPAPMETALTNRETCGHLCYLSWSQENSTVLPEPKFGPHSLPPPPLPIKNSWICPCNQLATHIRSDQVRSFCCNEQQSIEEPVVTALTPNGFNYTAEILELELQAEVL